MIFITTLFLVVEIVVQLNVPELFPLVSILKGIAVVTMLLGICIISKTVFDLSLISRSEKLKLRSK